jgi:hypothetical protein
MTAFLCHGSGSCQRRSSFQLRRCSRGDVDRARSASDRSRYRVDRRDGLAAGTLQCGREGSHTVREHRVGWKHSLAVGAREVRCSGVVGCHPVRGVERSERKVEGRPGGGGGRSCHLEVGGSGSSAPATGGEETQTGN